MIFKHKKFTDGNLKVMQFQKKLKIICHSFGVNNLYFHMVRMKIVIVSSFVGNYSI